MVVLDARPAAHARVRLLAAPRCCFCAQDIEVKSDLPGVGKNLRDHPAVSEFRLPFACMFFEPLDT